MNQPQFLCFRKFNCLVWLAGALLSLMGGCAEQSSETELMDAGTPPTLPDLSQTQPRNIYGPEDWGGGLSDITPDTKPYAITLRTEAQIERSDEPVEARPVTSGILTDLDMDGTQELIISSEGCCQPEEQVMIQSYDAEARSWIARPELENALSPASQAIVGALDVDGNGITDLIYSNPGEVIRWGNGDGTFSEPALDVTSHTNETKGLVQSYDFNGDGLLDLLIGSHQCNAMDGQSLIPVIQEGRKRWRIAPETLPESLIGGVFYAALIYPSPLSQQTLFLSGRPCSQADPNESFLLRSEDKYGEVTWEAIDPTTAESTYKTWPSISYGPLSKGHPMGVAIADMNEDGILDLMTTLDFRHLIFEGRSDGTLDDRTAASGFQAKILSTVPPISFATGWGVGTADMDGDGREDIIVANGPPDQHSPRMDMGISLFWNGGDFSFADVSEKAGLPEDGEWRSLAIDDLDQDGDPDLLVGGMGNPPRIFQNNILENPPVARVQLKGTLSNPHGVGAQISWNDGNIQQVRMMGHISSPGTQGIPGVFITFPADTEKLDLSILWPSGLKSEEVLEVGKNAIFEEASVVTIEPFSRWILADGKATAKVRLIPQNADQTFRLFASRNGSRSEVPLTTENDSLVYSWSATQEPGSVRFEIELNGELLHVRPIVYEVQTEEKP